MKNIFYLIVITLIIASCGANNTHVQQTDATKVESSIVTLSKEELEQTNIETATLQFRNLSNTTDASGMLDVPPQNKITIASPMNGFVKQTSLLEGTRVSKGQVLVELEHQDYIQLQQDYIDFGGQLEYLAAEYKRQQTLSLENINAQKTLQQSKSVYTTMLAKFQGIKAKLKLIGINTSNLASGNIQSTIKIVSPISGYVTKVNVNLGSYVSPTDIIFIIVNTEHLHAELTVFEKDIAKIKIGQVVRFKLSNETKERTATVHLIGREIKQDRTVQVHCHLDVEDDQLIPGTFLTAFIETENKKVASIPDKAIVKFDGTDYVFIKTIKGNFEMVKIKSGISEIGYTEITQNNKINDKTLIVFEGTFALLSKLKNTEEE